MFLLKKCLLIGGGLMICAAGVGFLGLRSYVISEAESQAEKVINSVTVENATGEETLLRVTAEVHRKFSEISPSSVLLLRLRPYLTHPLLPEFVRLPNGAIETVVQAGLCDNAARHLAFILAKLGYQSVQWDMVQSSAAHSGLLVSLSNNKNVLLDPFYGTASYSAAESRLISPEVAQQKLREGGETTDYFVQFSEKSQFAFYNNFANTSMAAEGEKLVITADIPKLGDERLMLGALDGNPDDVVFSTLKHNMTSYWSYVGHKYSRSWVRVLKAKQDVEVDFTLMQDVESSVITSEPAPKIDGRHMRWELKAGEEIRFFDGRAERSFKRMNSYLDVDQIVVRPLS